MAKALKIGHLHFKSKSAALLHFRSMLNRYRPADIVSDDDAELLSALLDRHPDASSKRGVGVHHFEVMSADFGTQCFAVVQTNGLRLDFSYIVCVNTDWTHLDA